jgi:hypothetical protein
MASKTLPAKAGAMQTVNQLFRLLNEMVFILVGALLLWVAFAGRYLFDPRRPSWLVVSVILILWGARSWRQARAAMAGRWRAAGRISGGSLALVGLLMLSLAWAPYRWTGLLLAAAGGLFVVRGLVTAAIMAVPSWRLPRQGERGPQM